MNRTTYIAEGNFHSRRLALRREGAAASSPAQIIVREWRRDDSNAC